MMIIALGALTSTSAQNRVYRENNTARHINNTRRVVRNVAHIAIGVQRVANSNQERYYDNRRNDYNNQPRCSEVRYVRSSQGDCWIFRGFRIFENDGLYSVYSSSGKWLKTNSLPDFENYIDGAPYGERILDVSPAYHVFYEKVCWLATTDRSSYMIVPGLNDWGEIAR